MTYKLELFLVLQNKKAYKYQIIQNIFFLMVYLYCTPCFFYTKLTHLAPKKKKKKQPLD